MSLSQDSFNDLDDQSTITRYINGSYYVIPKNVKSNSKNDSNCSSDGFLGFRGAKKSFNEFSGIGSRVPHLMGKVKYSILYVITIIVWLLYCNLLCCSVLYFTMLQCALLYRAVLCCAVLYYTALHYIWQINMELVVSLYYFFCLITILRYSSYDLFYFLN